MGFMAACGFNPAPIETKKAAEFRQSLIDAIEKAQQQAEDANFNSWDEMMNSVAETSGEITNIETANKVLDDAIAKARSVGVDEHMVLAVESVRPGALDENIRRYATSIPSMTNAEQTIVALESARGAGKFAIIALLIAAILKIISWVIGNGGKSKDDVDGDVVETKEKTKEKADEVRDRDQSGKLSGFSDAVAAAAGGSMEKNEDSKTDHAKMLSVAEKFSDAIKTHPGLSTLITAIDSRTKGEILYSTFTEALKVGSDEAVSAAFLNGLRRSGFLSIFYNPKAISALLKHPKLKGQVGINQRMPTVTMWLQSRNAIDRTVGMVDMFNKVLVSPNDQTVTDVYTAVDGFMEDFLLKGNVFEQPRMSDAMYETPFTQRMSEQDWSEGYASLGSRIITLSEAGSIGKGALNPIYAELGALPLTDMLEVVGAFADEVVTQNGNGRFKDVIKVDTQWAKTAKSRIDGYNKTIKSLKGDENKDLLEAFEAATSQLGLRPTKNMRTMDGTPAEPFDVLSDMAKAMRSLWETYATLQQCADKHNNYSGLMRNLAEAKK